MFLECFSFLQLGLRINSKFSRNNDCCSDKLPEFLQTEIFETHMTQSMRSGSSIGRSFFLRLSHLKLIFQLDSVRFRCSLVLIYPHLIQKVHDSENGGHIKIKDYFGGCF